MWNRQYYDGFEGEGEIKVWYTLHGNKIGMVIWIGYFETILDGCFHPGFEKNGIVECGYNRDGLYDREWKVQDPYIVLRELKGFNEDNVKITDSEMLEETKEIIVEIISLINTAIKYGASIFFEYE